MTYNPIRLEVYKHLFAAIPEEMGAVLRKSSFSPNIKERRDFSCALFDATGNMIAQAAHIPVHLGAMPLSVAAAINRFQNSLSPGDVIVLNHPYQGGSHLPDITMVSPVFISVPNSNKSDQILFGFTANRAHHADVGGMTPGSMPIAREIFQEGIIIPPIKLVSKGEINLAAWELLLANVRTSEERAGDLQAQLAANQRGIIRLQELVNKYGVDEIKHYMAALLEYTELMTRRLLEKLPDGTYTFVDYLDDDGILNKPIAIRVAITINKDTALVDFSGSAPQQLGSVNAVYSITLSAVYYVFRCLLGLDIPNNTGCLAPIEVVAPVGTVVNAQSPAPVAGGNVETSQRIVDVILGALSRAIPDLIPAASQGTMNNVTIGGQDFRKEKPKLFAYYETIAGGTGGTPQANGVSARHTHMTNTLNTPVEALEYAYPLKVIRYEIRSNTGGLGIHSGGDGIRRDIQVIYPAEANLLTDRRITKPYGLAGGNPGKTGKNILIRNDKEIALPGKGPIELNPGDILSIRTPGGGGWGKSNLKNQK